MFFFFFFGQCFFVCRAARLDVLQDRGSLDGVDPDEDVADIDHEGMVVFLSKVECDN